MADASANLTEPDARADDVDDLRGVRLSRHPPALSRRTDRRDLDPMHDDDNTDEPVRPARREVMPIPKAKDETRSRAAARAALAPGFGATLALHAVHEKNGALYRDLDLGDLTDELRRTVSDESATGTERLHAQALVLERLFTHLAGVAMQQDYLSGMTPALTLALRAQAQCRQTWQTISDIRHPRQYVGTQHVGEQYNAGGHQQVNRHARGSADENRPNELSHEEEPTRELHPNRGTPAGVESAGVEDAPVGTLDRTANGGGQGRE